MTMEATTNIQSETSNPISFGISEIGQETPAKIKLIYRWLMFLSLVWTMAVQPRVTCIPAEWQYNIDSILLIANNGIYFFCNCFGYANPGQNNSKK
jgi:hypothetical protein